ncbi:MAG: hypothetical protein ACR2P1_15040, partial [Pseudomonadales bacterium]
MKNVLTLTIAIASGLALISAQSTATMLEEVVVTAQKREQSQQDIPIAIAAFSADQLASLGSSNLQDLIEHVSGAE